MDKIKIILEIDGGYNLIRVTKSQLELLQYLADEGALAYETTFREVKDEDFEEIGIGD